VAEDFLCDDEFIMYLGDNIIKGGIVQHAERFKLLGPEALVLLTEVDDPQRFGVAEFDEGGQRGLWRSRRCHRPTSLLQRYACPISSGLARA